MHREGLSLFRGKRFGPRALIPDDLPRPSSLKCSQELTWSMGIKFLCQRSYIAVQFPAGPVQSLKQGQVHRKIRATGPTLTIMPPPRRESVRPSC